MELAVQLDKNMACCYKVITLKKCSVHAIGLEKEREESRRKRVGMYMRVGLHMQPVISAQFCERELGPAPAGFTGGYKEAIGFGRARLTERRATQVARAKP